LRWQAVFGSQIVWNKWTRCAGARGGARVGRPRWLRILTITTKENVAPIPADILKGTKNQIGHSANFSFGKGIQECPI